MKTHGTALERFSRMLRAIFARLDGKRMPGALRGKLHAGPEFFEELPADELARWE